MFIPDWRVGVISFFSGFALFLKRSFAEIVHSGFFYLRCNIQGSVICNYAHIKEGCTIKDCQVGANHTVKGE